VSSPGQMLGSVAWRYRRPTGRRVWPPMPVVRRPGPGRAAPAPVEANVRGPAARSRRLAGLEAALLLAREPLGSRKLAELADLTDGTEARTLVRQLNELYNREGCAFRAVEVAGGFQLMSRPKFAPWLRRLHPVPVEVRLSGPAIETLAVVAYRQQVLRAAIEAIRGVQCGEILRQLMERDLVRIVGRSEELGRPFLYGTTKQFLQVFGLRHLDELPRPARPKWPGGLDAQPAPSTEPIPDPSTSNPLDDSGRSGRVPNVKTSASNRGVGKDAVETRAASMIEQEQVRAADDDFEDEFDDEDEDFDDDEDDDFDDEDEEDDEDDEDEDFEDDDWEEVDDEEEEEEEEEEDEDDWDDEDEDDDDWE